jgi:hypothetical protein
MIQFIWSFKGNPKDSKKCNLIFKKNIKMIFFLIWSFEDNLKDQ